MASPYQLFPQMEGLVGTMATSADATQHVATWVEMCKMIMLMPGNRDLTDWKFQALSDLDEDGSAETGAADLIAATKIYGLLAGQLDDQINCVVAFDGDTNTLDGNGALADATAFMIRLPAVTTSGVEEYQGIVSAKGFALGTGLTVCGDGVDGTTPGASDMRGWILFR